MSASSIIEQLTTLSLADLRHVAAATAELISQIEAWQQPDSSTPHKTYRQEYTRCGKQACQCTTGLGHGPYWYAYTTVAGKTKKEYIGKQAPPGA